VERSSREASEDRQWTRLPIARGINLHNPIAESTWARADDVEHVKPRLIKAA